MDAVGIVSERNGSGTKSYHLISFHMSPGQTVPQTRHRRLNYSFVDPHFSEARKQEIRVILVSAVLQLGTAAQRGKWLQDYFS